MVDLPNGKMFEDSSKRLDIIRALDRQTDRHYVDRNAIATLRWRMLTRRAVETNPSAPSFESHSRVNVKYSNFDSRRWYKNIRRMWICIACLGGSVGWVTVGTDRNGLPGEPGFNPRYAGRFHVRISGAHALRLISRAGKEGSTVSSIICDRWLILS